MAKTSKEDHKSMRKAKDKRSKKRPAARHGGRK